MIFFFVFLFFYFIKISKFALPGVMLMYERTSKDRKKEKKKERKNEGPEIHCGARPQTHRQPTYLSSVTQAVNADEFLIPIRNKRNIKPRVQSDFHTKNIVEKF